MNTINCHLCGQEVVFKREASTRNLRHLCLTCAKLVCKTINWEFHQRYYDDLGSFQFGVEGPFETTYYARFLQKVKDRLCPQCGRFHQ